MRGHLLIMLLATAGYAAGATAQNAAGATVDFGDDTGPYANDRQCDDPRFIGSSSAASADSEARDAADCRTAYEAGRVALLTPAQIAVRNFTGLYDGINFGDNAGVYARDGQCDDPRFKGETVSSNIADHEMHDAADCRAAYVTGAAQLRTPEELAARTFTGVYDGIDFGDNSGVYVNDSYCDDPRFTGEGAPVGFDSEEMHDSADCYATYLAGTARLRTPEELAARNFTGVFDGVDFGLNDGDAVRNGQCEDPRFTGESALYTYDDALMHDAADCYIAYSDGKARLFTEQEMAARNFTGVFDGVDFGDNDGDAVRNGQCEDPRFWSPAGYYAYDTALMHDAADCRTAYEAGRIAVLAPEQIAARNFEGVYDGVDFGDNTGVYARDGQCDDPRFKGDTVSYNIADHELHDAADCRAAYMLGEAELMTPEDMAARNFTGVFDGVDFGDNNGDMAHTRQCEDPRFTGEIASYTYDAALMHDSGDCYVGFRDGTARLLTEEEAAARNFTGVYDGVDFGDNSGSFVRDNECDDPRFTGEGTSNGAFPDERMRDSADCYAGVLAGTVTYVGDDGAPAAP